MKLLIKRSLILSLITLLSLSGFAFTNINSILLYNDIVNSKMSKVFLAENYSKSSSNIEYKSDGEIVVSDDDKEIVSITPGGYLKFSIKTFGNKRIIKINSDSDGTLKYEYFENKQEKPFDPDGKQLLSEVLIDIIRLSGIDSNNRTNRIYSKEGLDGFITEIMAISSNRVRSIYFNHIIVIPTLSNSELVTIAENIPVRISSETECAILYRKHGKTFAKSPESISAYLRSVKKMFSNTERGSVLRSIHPYIDINEETVAIAYFNAVNTLESNTEKGSVLRDLYRTKKLSDESFVTYLMATQKLTSSTELGLVLRSIKEINLNNPVVATAYFSATNTITSNTEIGSVLRYTYKNHAMDKAAMTSFLMCAKRITSNTELGNVLRSIDMKEYIDDYNMMKTYFATVNSISSNTEKGWVLRKLVKTTTLNSDAFVEFYYATKRLSSNTELGYVITESIQYLPNDRKVIDAFFLATNSISSNTEHGRVLRELIRRGKLNEYTIYEIMHSTKRISSNTEISSVLVELSKLIPKDNEKMVSEFKKTAGSLSSTTEFKRVMRSIE